MLIYHYSFYRLTNTRFEPLPLLLSNMDIIFTFYNDFFFVLIVEVSIGALSVNNNECASYGSLLINSTVALSYPDLT